MVFLAPKFPEFPILTLISKVQISTEFQNQIIPNRFFEFWQMSTSVLNLWVREFLKGPKTLIFPLFLEIFPLFLEIFF